MAKSFPTQRFRWSALALVLAAWPGAEAAAQLGAAPEIARGVTVGNRPRRDYDPLGVRLGAFRLDAFAEAGPGFDSNLFGDRRAARADGFAADAAGFNLESGWGRHAAGIAGNFEGRQYFRNGDLNFQDFDIGGFGRYDLSADSALEGRYRHYRQHLDVSSTDVQAAGISRPVPYDTDEVQVTGRTRFNRLGLLADGSYRAYRFQDATFGGVRSQLSVNDFDSTVGALGASYLLAPGRSVTTLIRLQDISYTAGGTARDRDSFTWEALAGFEYDFDGVWQGRVAFGWRQRDYKGPIRSLSGPAVEGQLTYVPTQLTTLRLNIARTIEESIRLDAVSYDRTRFGLAIDHEYLRNVILTAELRFDIREYQSPKQTAADGQLLLAVRWQLNRGVALVGSYAYANRFTATGGLTEYDRNLVLLRLRLTL